MGKSKRSHHSDSDSEDERTKKKSSKKVAKVSVTDPCAAISADAACRSPSSWATPMTSTPLGMPTC